MRRRIRRTALSGIAATLLGIGGILVLLFAPVYPAETNGGRGLIHFRVGLAVGGNGQLVPLPSSVIPGFIATVICLLAVACGAALFERGILGGRLLLWSPTILLIVVVALITLSDVFGVRINYLWISQVPAIALALVASLAASRNAGITGAHSGQMTTP